MTSKLEPKPSDALMFLPLLPLIPLGGAFAHYLANRRSWSRGAKWALAGSAALVGLGLARWQLDRFVQKEPDFAKIDDAGKLEIRMYPAGTFVSTNISADFENALEQGFERLFKYINGENATGEKIEMTSPVTSQRNGQHYTISFFMPPERNVDNLPKPTNPELEIVTVAERTVAVMPFSGRYDTEHVKKAMAEFKELASQQQLRIHGKPVFAAFDAPSTLPAIRHNEVWSELKNLDQTPAGTDA